MKQIIFVNPSNERTVNDFLWKIYTYMMTYFNSSCEKTLDEALDKYIVTKIGSIPAKIGICIEDYNRIMEQRKDLVVDNHIFGMEIEIVKPKWRKENEIHRKYRKSNI